MDKVKLLKAIEVVCWNDLERVYKSESDTNRAIQSLLNVRALLAQMDTKGLEDK